MTKKSIIKTLAIAALGAASASASILAPGQQLIAPDIFTSLPGTLVFSQTLSLNSLTFAATVTEAVYRGGATAACGGASTCLNFLFQVTDNGAVNMSTGIIEDLTSSFYTGFVTDAGYVNLGAATSLFAAGGVNPNTVGRSAAGPGGVIQFDYPNSAGGASDFGPGQHTSVLVVETNATMFSGNGFFSGIDGATATTAGLEPTSTPEPATMFLFGSALIGIGFIRKRATAK